MSEHQYYEFLAVDRPLTQDEMSELRGVSSRAEITPTHFSNHYNYGDLRGDPEKLLERYFDIFLYTANWGSRRFAMRLPREAAAWEEIEPYCGGWTVRARQTDDHVIIDVQNDAEEGWDEWLEAPGWMASLAAVRQELLQGDMRSLYLAWLLHVSGPDAEDDFEAEEPPVPPGLTTLPASLRALTDFLLIDEHLLAAAAEGSPAEAPRKEGLAEWIAQLPAAEKDALLLRVAQGEGGGVAATLARGFRGATRTADPEPEQPRRTVEELLDRADELKEEREQERRRLADEERRRREAAEAAAKDKRLDALAPRKAAAWQDVERFVESKQQQAYDEAVKLLVDLRDLVERDGEEWHFTERFSALLALHARKRAFIARVGKAGLPTRP